MVAISLYRGNLHRVPDVPRRWLMPNHTISLKDFKSLTRKRDKTLSRLRSTTTTTTTAATTSSNPNPNPNPNSIAEQQKQHEFVGDNGCSKQNPAGIATGTIEPTQPETQTTDVAANVIPKALETVDEDPVQQHRMAGDAKDQTGSAGDNCVEDQRKGIGDSVASPDAKIVVQGGNGVAGVSQPVNEEKQPALPVEISNNVDLLSEKEKKKRDLEQNLKVLNERKHNLVQMLKQILNAEEEIKRRSNTQLSAGRPSGPQQLEATTDLGSNPREVVNRVDPEANFCGDLEGESEDLSNHNTNARQPHQMRSTSPSSSSPLRKAAANLLLHSVVPQSNKPSLGVNGHAQTTSGGIISSPSRFGPSGQQGQPGNLPPLSVSGTHCTGSSPSPAGSGGTSVFRDARITSPSWN